MPISPKANLLRAIHHADPQYVPWIGEGVLQFVDYRGRKPPRSGVDEWGVTWAPFPASYPLAAGEPAESFPVAHPATDIADLLRLELPAFTDPSLFADLLDGLDRERVLPIGRHGLGPLDRLFSLLGMERALSALMAEPEASRAVLERIAEVHVALACSYIAAGAEAGWLADDYAGAGGPYLRPSHWRQIVLPALARVFAPYREAGLPVFFHTCGKAEVFVPDLLAAGVTVFNLQSSACDLGALKARFGRQIAFIGGVASELLLRGTPAEVRQATAAAIAALHQGGGLIVGPDQPLAFPPENEAALTAAAQDYGGYWKHIASPTLCSRTCRAI